MLIAAKSYIPISIYFSDFADLEMSTWIYYASQIIHSQILIGQWLFVIGKWNETKKKTEDKPVEFLLASRRLRRNSNEPNERERKRNKWTLLKKRKLRRDFSLNLYQQTNVCLFFFWNLSTSVTWREVSLTSLMAIITHNLISKNDGQYNGEKLFDDMTRIDTYLWCVWEMKPSQWPIPIRHQVV